MKVNTEKSVGSHGNGNNSEATSSCRKRGKHDANLQKNGFLRFQIGLIVALAMVYLAVELSTAQKDVLVMADEDPIEDAFEYHKDLAKKIRIEKPKETQPKQKKKVVNPDKLVIKKDDDFVEKPTFIETESSEDKPIDVDDITEAIIDDPVETIPFIALEDAPIFPGCEKVAKKERLECFNKKMKKHIKRHFRYPDAAIEMEQQGRVDVMFKIGPDGNIQIAKMRGPAPILEKEAARIIDKLPKMTPGKQRGRPVIVPFSVPINFRLN